MNIAFNNGCEIPKIGLGTYRLKGDQVRKLVYDAVVLGYRHIDTAAVYKNEREIGLALTDLFQNGVVNRSELFITSKIQPKDMGYVKTKKAVEESLHNLNLEYLDLMLVHWPGTQKLKFDNPKNKINRIESVTALMEFRKDDVLKAVGVSNFNVNHFQGVEDCSIQLNQIEFHPLLWCEKTAEIVEYCQKRDIVIGGYSCLGEGKLLESEKFPELSKIALETGYSIAQVLIAWALAKGCVVTPKASTIERLKENIRATEIRLSQSHMLMLDNLSTKYGVTKYCWDSTNIA
ncbi:aldo-keto reductase [Globomyces pollinis-pini]|nr:aldo-keto reductase [Globomyces pollinis-pini]